MLLTLSTVLVYTTNIAKGGRIMNFTKKTRYRLTVRAFEESSGRIAKKDIFKALKLPEEVLYNLDRPQGIEVTSDPEKLMDFETCCSNSFGEKSQDSTHRTVLLGADKSLSFGKYVHHTYYGNSPDDSDDTREQIPCDEKIDWSNPIISLGERNITDEERDCKMFYFTIYLPRS